MATESPIWIVDGGDRWPVLKKSARYRSSASSKMSIEDLGLLLRDQRFRSPEKDATPCRSESAPPSMEGSVAALGTIFSFNRSAAARTMNSDSSSFHGEAHRPVSLRLPIHAEESEDDQSSERSCSLSAEKAFGGIGTKQEDCSESREGNNNLHCSDEIISRVSSRDFAASWHSGIDEDVSHQNSDAVLRRHPLAPPPHLAGSYPQLVYPSIGNAAQPLLHASGYTPPPLYAANAAVALGGGYYPNIGYVAQHFNVAGYNPSSYHLPGYGVNVHPPPPGFYCQAPTDGMVPMNPSFFGMGYFRPDPYRHLGRQDGGGGVNQMNPSFPRKSPEAGDGKSQHAPVTNLRRRGAQSSSSSSYYTAGSSRNDGGASSKHIPTSFAKPLSGGRYNTPHWDGPNSYSYLEELKSGKGQRLELSDIMGHIIEFSVDQHGSRFIQQKLEICSVEEKESVLSQVIPHAWKLMTDVFGNYVIQKLFEYGSSDQRKRLTNQLQGQILNLSLQMYGCRVIQKALEVIDLEQKTRLARELDGHVLRCVRDQNGNHVIQKCIESIPTDSIHFIVSAFRGQVASLSMHPYGCRVIQRVLEHCSDDEQTQFIVDEILESVSSLARDQYGNYVTQHVLERGKAEERRDVVVKLSGSVVQLSQHKFASNVIEKCIEYGDAAARGVLVKEMVSDENLLMMMKDQFANYVVQKVVEKSCGDEKEALLGMIRNHLTTLRKYTYGKHFVARFERLCVEENNRSR